MGLATRLYKSQDWWNLQKYSQRGGKEQDLDSGPEFRKCCRGKKGFAFQSGDNSGGLHWKSQWSGGLRTVKIYKKNLNNCKSHELSN